MGNENSTANPEQPSAHSIDPQPRERINVPMVQNVLLIWLDSNINENSSDSRNTITQLRHVVNSINTFIDSDQCIEFLRINSDEKACMIISGSLGERIVPRVHTMSQVDSIYIFCHNKQHHEQWVKEWGKIKGVFTDIIPICEALKQAANECEQNAMPICFMTTGGDLSKKKLDQLDASFMYTQILKEIFLTIKFEQQHIQEFVQYCRNVLAKNEKELRNVKKLEEQYHTGTPIWWYTYECFLYPMLNRALRLMDVDIIIKMGFFINDLHRHIQRLHSIEFTGQKSQNSFIAYRGQGLPKMAFDKMVKTKGGLIAFNNFLSTSKNRDVSLHFARSSVLNPDLMGIVFVMTIDPSKFTTPFASITNVSYYKDNEDEVLFSMHTVFRIGEIIPIDENKRLFSVELALTSDKDQDLCALTDCIREETFSNSTGWDRLGKVLLKLDQSNKALQVYSVLLGQAMNEREIVYIYDQIGLAKYNLGENQEALKFYEKSLEIKQKILPLNDPDLAISCNNIGLVYYNRSDYLQALVYYRKALEIWQQSLPANHPNLGTCYNNIGEVYRYMADYSRALSYYEKVLEVKQQSLPPNHPELATTYNNIGTVYENLGMYSKALPCYGKALKTWQQSLPPNHPYLVLSYNNIGMMYYNMHDYSKARSFCERAVEIGQHALPPNHPHLQLYRKNLNNIKAKIATHNFMFFWKKI